MSKLLNAVKDFKEAMGTFTELDVKQFADLEQKAIEMELKANEVMHTTNTGFGEELIPINVLAPEPILNLVSTYSKLFPLLSAGNQGSNMAISEKIAIVGQADLMTGNVEWITGAPLLNTNPQNKVYTDKVDIAQGQFIINIDVSKREMNYSIGNLEAIIKLRLNQSAARTIDNVIINADSDLTVANINKLGVVSSGAVTYAQNDDGIRKTAIINDPTVVHDVAGALGDADFIKLLSLVPDYSANLSDMLFIEPANVYYKSIGLDSVKTLDKFGPNATILSGVLAKIFGIDLLVSDQWPSLTDADGKIDALTPNNNTKGSMGLVYKPAILHGFGQPVEIESTRIAGKGTRFTSTMEYGFGIAHKKAQLGSVLAVAVNITI